MMLRSVALLFAALAVGLLGAGCHSTPLTTIGDGWRIDTVASGRTAAHLYRETDDTRVLVDRQVEGWRLYGNRCLMYEAARPDGRLLFVVWGSLTPVAVAKIDVQRPWRFDVDGLRRFETPPDPDGRTLLTIEWLEYGSICYLAQMQPRWHDNWAKAAPSVASRLERRTSVVDVHGTDTVG